MHRFLSISFLFIALMSSTGQTVVFVGQTSNSAPRYLYQIDLATCTYCPILPLPVGSQPLVLPTGDIAIGMTNSVTIYVPPSSAPVTTITTPWSSGIVHPNGTVYVSTGTALATIDPITFTIAFIGNFPPGVNIDALFTVGNTLYGFGYAGPGTRPVYEINITNPSLSTQVYPFASYISSATTASNGQVITSWPGGGSQPQVDFSVYNLASNSWTTLCQTPLLVSGISAVPTGVSYSCVCLQSSAGTPVTSTASVCVTNPFTANFNPNVQLDPDDVVNFILYTDAANPTTSVLFQNTTGVFTFQPPMQAGTTYYVSRIVGNATANVVSLIDPCLDVSPPIALTWQPLPQLVSLTANTTDLCANDCESVNLQLQGTPPFSYGWQWQQGGILIGNQTTVFNQPGNFITFQACAPPNASGSLQLVLCGIVDAFCVNQP